nr:Verru_Chthon cassette protein D [Verrucomicrobium spinosum]
MDPTPPLFAFKPEGGTTLPRASAGQWCITLALAADEERTNKFLPANFRTLVLNPHTGSAVMY